MTSPFPPTSSSPGRGHISVHLLPHNISALQAITFQYPLKLISPNPSASQKSSLVFLLTYGGGLVGGDAINLYIDVHANARLSLVTQGHTKIFKSPDRKTVTSQSLHVTIEKGAAICLLPDPVQPFKESVYVQDQRFYIENGGSLVVLDWVTAGRKARNEEWEFWSWRGRNEVWAATSSSASSQLGRHDGTLLLRDNVILEDLSMGPANSGRDVKEQMAGMGLFGTLIMRGELMDALADFFLDEFSNLPRIGARDFRSDDKKERDDRKGISEEVAWRNMRLEQEKQDDILWSAAKVRGCTVVKFGARTVEGGRTWIGSMIKREGSVMNNFGEDAIMCIR